MKEIIIGVLAGTALVILSWLPGKVANLLSEPQVGEFYRDAEAAYKQGYYLKAIDNYKVALIKSHQEIDKINYKINRLCTLAEYAYEDGNYSEAVDKYEEALKVLQKSSITEIERLCAEAERARTRNDTKIKNLRKNVEQDLNDKDYDEARNKYRLALSKDKFTFFRDYERAINKYKEALKKSKEQLPRDQTKIAGIEDEIETLLESVDDEEKIKSLCDTTEAEADYQDEKFSAAIDKYNETLEELQKRFDESIDKYKKAVKLSQENRITAIEKMSKDARRFHKKGNYERAAKIYSRALKTSAYERVTTLRVNFNLLAHYRYREFNTLAQYQIAACYANLVYKKIPYIERTRKEGESAYEAGDYLTSVEKYQRALEESQKEILEGKPEIVQSLEEARIAYDEKWDNEQGKTYDEKEYQEVFRNYADAVKSENWGIDTEAQRLAEDDFKGKKYQDAADKYKPLTESLEWAKDKDFASLALSSIEEIGNEVYYLKNSDYQEGIVYLHGNLLFEQGKKYEEDLAKLQEGNEEIENLRNKMEQAYRETKPIFEDFITKFPDSPFIGNALYALGNINYSLSNADEAQVNFQKLTKIPNSDFADEARFFLAQSYFKGERFEEAYRAYDELIKEPYWGNKLQREEAEYKAIHSLLQLVEKKDLLVKKDLKENEPNWNNLLDLNQLLNQYDNFAKKYPKSQFIYAVNFDMGVIYLQQGKKKEASKFFAQAANEEKYKSLVPIARLGEAYSYYVQNNLETAKQTLPSSADFEKDSYFQRYILDLDGDINQQVQSGKIWSRSEAADNSFNSGDYSTAADEYNKVWIEDDRKDVYRLKFRAKFRQGLSYFKAANEESDESKQDTLLENSIAAYKDAIGYAKGKDSITTNDLDKCRYNLAIAYQSQGKWEEAKKIFGQITDSELTDSAYIQFLDMHISVSKDKIGEAITKLDSSESGRLNQVVRLDLAKLQYDIGRIAKAAKFRAEAAKLYKEGDYQKSAEKYIEAAKLYEEIVKEDTRINTARNLYDGEKYSEAAKSYREIVNSYSDDVAEKIQGVDQISLANSKYGEGKYDEAARLYDEEATRRLSEAARIYENVAADNNRHLETAKRQYDDGVYDEAAKLYKDFVDLHRDINEKENPNANINEAQSLYAEEKYDVAAQLYKKIAENKASKVQYLAGVCHYHSGNLQKAIEIFDKVIEDINNSYRLDAYYGKCLATKDSPEQESSNKWEEIGNVAAAAHEAFPNPDDKEKKILDDIDLLRAYAKQKEFLAGGIPALVEEQRDIIRDSQIPEEKAKAQQKIGDLYYGDPTFGNPVAEYSGSAINSYNEWPKRMAMYQIAASRYYGKRMQEPSYPQCIAAVNDIFREYSADILDAQMSARLYFMRGDSKYKQDSKDIAGAISDLEKAIEAANQIDQIGNKQYKISKQSFPKFDAYYQIGTLYQKLEETQQAAGDETGGESKYPQKAINILGDLLKEYDTYYKSQIEARQIEKEEAQNIVDKVVDAGVTKARLIADSGDLDTAVEEITELQSNLNSVSEHISQFRKTQMQYTFGYLSYQRMLELMKAGSDISQESKRAINTFIQVRRSYLPDDINATEPKKPPEQVIPFLRDSLFLLGMVYYQLQGIELDNDQKGIYARNALDSFQYLVDCVNKGALGKIQEDTKLQDFFQRANFQIAIIYKEAKKYKKSISQLEYLKTRFPNAANKPSWQYEIGDAKFLQAEQSRNNISEYEAAKNAYNEVLEIDSQHNIADDALWSMIVCWNNIKRLTANSDRKRQIEEDNIVPLCERLVNNYPQSDFLPNAYLFLGAYYFHREEHNTALDNFRRAYEHSKPGTNIKTQALQNIQTTVIPLIESNILRAQELRTQNRDIDALTPYGRAASLCLTLITYFSEDNDVRTQVRGYILDGRTIVVVVNNQNQNVDVTPVKTAVEQIENLGIENPLIPQINDTIGKIEEWLRNPDGMRDSTRTDDSAPDSGSVPGGNSTGTSSSPTISPSSPEAEIQIDEKHPLIYKSYELLAELYVIRGDGFVNAEDYIHAKENYNLAIDTYNRIIKYIETYGE